MRWAAPLRSVTQRLAMAPFSFRMDIDSGAIQVWNRPSRRKRGTHAGRLRPGASISKPSVAGPTAMGRPRAPGCCAPAPIRPDDGDGAEAVGVLEADFIEDQSGKGRFPARCWKFSEIRGGGPLRNGGTSDFVGGDKAPVLAPNAALQGLPFPRPGASDNQQLRSPIQVDRRFNGRTLSPADLDTVSSTRSTRGLLTSRSIPKQAMITFDSSSCTWTVVKADGAADTCAPAVGGEPSAVKPRCDRWTRHRPPVERTGDPATVYI